MYQLRKTASTYPKTFHFVSKRHEVISVFSGSAGEAPDRDIFFPGLGFCFFSVKLNGMLFFNGNCTFRTNAYAEAHTITEFFGYYFRFSVNDSDSTFGARSNTFSTACAFLFINFYYQSFHHK